MATVLTKPNLARRSTENDLMRMPDDEFRYELVDGEIIRMPPSGFEHDTIASELHGRLFPHTKGRGYMTMAQAGFRTSPGNVRAPDLSFTLKERLPGEKPVEGFADLAPDIAVEIVSPGNTKKYLVRKTREFFDGGSKLVWIIHPKGHTVDVYTSPTDVRTLSGDDELDGGSVLPTFRCRVTELFP